MNQGFKIEKGIDIRLPRAFTHKDNNRSLATHKGIELRPRFTSALIFRLTRAGSHKVTDFRLRTRAMTLDTRPCKDIDETCQSTFAIISTFVDV